MAAVAISLRMVPSPFQRPDSNVEGGTGTHACLHQSTPEWRHSPPPAHQKPKGETPPIGQVEPPGLQPPRPLFHPLPSPGWP